MTERKTLLVKIDTGGVKCDTNHGGEDSFEEIIAFGFEVLWGNSDQWLVVIRLWNRFLVLLGDVLGHEPAVCTRLKRSWLENLILKCSVTRPPTVFEAGIGLGLVTSSFCI